MDIASKLHELTQEILKFGAVFSYTTNADDVDFRNACELFSQYLKHQISLILANTQFQNAKPDVLHKTAQLRALSELITPQ